MTAVPLWFREECAVMVKNIMSDRKPVKVIIDPDCGVEVLKDVKHDRVLHWLIYI
jgi:hypothetical protein